MEDVAERDGLNAVASNVGGRGETRRQSQIGLTSSARVWRLISRI